MIMELNDQKAEFSHAWLYAVAAAAKLRYTRGPSPDDDSVDAVLAARGLVGSVRSPSLRVQLKCTGCSRHAPPPSFDLPIKNYDDMRPTDLQTPHILVVLEVPNDLSWWTRQKGDYLALRRCAYWASVRGAPPTSNLDTIAVPIVRSQQVTPASLQAIMLAIGKGNPP